MPEEVTAVLEQDTIEPGNLSDEDLGKLVDTPETPEAPADAAKTVEATDKTPVAPTVKEGQPAEKPAETKPSMTPEELEKTKKRLNDAQAFIQRQAQEIGMLRKQTPEEIQERIKKINELAIEGDYVSAQTEYQKLQTEQQQIQLQQAQQTAGQNLQTLTTLIPNLPEVAPHAIAVAMEEDGVTQQQAEQFFQSALLEHPVVAWAMTKRGETFSALKQAKAEIATLKAENAELKKKPGEVLKKVEQSLKSSKPLSASSGQAPATFKPSDISEAQLSEMSDAELNDLLKDGG